MQWKEWLEKWSMTSLKIKSPFLDMNWEPKDPDKNAAWALLCWDRHIFLVIHHDPKCDCERCGNR